MKLLGKMLVLSFVMFEGFSGFVLLMCFGFFSPYVKRTAYSTTY